MTVSELKNIFKQARKNSGYKLAEIERLYNVKRGSIYYSESERSNIIDINYVLFLLEHTNFSTIYEDVIKNAEETV